MSNRVLAGRYELIEKIGEGGMAVVYKAKDKLLNRYIAIKILRPEFTKDAQFVENFKKESQAAAALTHPNIVSVYDVGKEGNINYIVMELIDGKPLSEVIKESAPMDYRRVIEISKQITSALALAHRNDIIHRDVKPHNILVTHDGIAKLADFGIAKAMSDATLVNGTSRIIGSVHYFSPEQARGNYVDERSDLYSLGIVMYEMLTGRVPFDGDNPVSVALMHINDQIIPPSQLVGGVPPQLEKLIMKATDKLQINRYKSADEMLEELDNIEFVTKVVGNGVFSGMNGSGYGDGRFEEPRKESHSRSVTKEKPRYRDEDIIDEKPGKSSGSDKKDAGKKKKMIIIIAAAAVVVLGGLAFALSQMGIIGGGDIEVPSLLGKTYEQAEAELADIGLQIAKGDEVNSDEYEKDEICSQNPSEGSMVKEGKTVVVNISIGVGEGSVPNLKDKDYEEVEAYLEKFGFKLGVVEKDDSELPEGTVIGQTPAAGEVAPEGTKVNIVISNGKGESEGTVPILTGLTVDEAKAKIIAEGFAVGDINYDFSTAYGKNYVMWQEYGANTKLEKGTKIGIIISKGAEEDEPDAPDEE